MRFIFFLLNIKCYSSNIYQFHFCLVLGTGHIVPTTFYGRLLAITTGLIGIPLYALFLKHFGECILYLNKRLLGLCEGCGRLCKKGAYKNTKIVLVSFLEMMLIIFLGALGAFPFDWPYFDGKLVFMFRSDEYLPSYICLVLILFDIKANVS